MNYIQIGRQLDTLARTDGYMTCPDDILNLILDFTGRMDYKPTFLYRVEIKFRYDKYRYTYDRNTQISSFVLVMKDKLGYCYFHYCSACCRFYANHKSHLGRDKHIHNVRNGNDKGKDIKDELRDKVIEKYRNSSYTQNVRVLGHTMKDVWTI